MRTVAAGSAVPQHCQLPPKFIGTLTREAWERMRRETTKEITGIIARKEARIHNADEPVNRLAPMMIGDE